MSYSNYLFIFLGGGLGALVRCILSIILKNNALIIINILGSFFLGIILVLFANNSKLLSLLAIGLLGGFTSFSSFSSQIFTFINNESYIKAIIYSLSSVLLSLLAFIIGRYMTNYYLNN